MCCSNESQYLLCSGVTDHINVVFMTEVLKLFELLLLLLLLFVDLTNKIHQFRQKCFAFEFPFLISDNVI